MPANVDIEIDGKRATGPDADEGRLAIRGALEQALALEHYHQRYVFASGPTAERAARDVDRWLGWVKVCSETSEPQAAVIDSVEECALDLDGTTVVFMNARLHLTSKKRKAGQIAAGTLIAAAGVAVVALAVLAIAKGDSGGCGGSSVTADIAVNMTDVVARAAVAGIDAYQLRPICRETMQPVTADRHGFWTRSHLDLAVAVLAANGELLWYRSGKLPLNIEKPEKAGRNLAKFLQGMP